MSLGLIVLILLVVLIEVGTTLPGVLRSGSVPVTALPDHPPFTSEQQRALDQLSNQDHPPGQGIPDLAGSPANAQASTADAITAASIPRGFANRQRLPAARLTKARCSDVSVR